MLKYSESYGISSGKTWSLSIVASFLLLHHETYILHNTNPDYVAIIIAPQEKQIKSFKNYIRSFLDTSKGIGIISDKLTESSELNLAITRNNNDEINIAKLNGSVHSIAYFGLGAESIEGKHGNVLFSDESKFLLGKTIRTSILPTVGARGGIMCMLSSAHDKWSPYQDEIEKNIEKDKIDHLELGTRCIITGSNENRNLCFNGRRHFQQHWDRMVDHNDEYAMAIDRALESVGQNREDPSFATQYDNIFLSKKSSSFFDIKELGTLNVFRNYNAFEYINNPKYVIIAGWDVALTGDNSILTIKAIENGHGADRKSHLLFSYILNPSKNKQSDSVYNQSMRIYRYIKNYNISAIAVDETGVGIGACSYLKEFIRKDFYTRMQESNIFDVVFGNKNRFEILENYYNRIQSGMELFPEVDDSWIQDDHIRNIYINTVYNSDANSCWSSFVYEHVKFNRIEIQDDRTGMVKVEYRQLNENHIHDDHIFSSALSSYCLRKNPNLFSVSGSAIATSTPSKYFKRKWK